jgi:hypothetical protein
MINSQNLVKYMIMFVVVSTAALLIPSCGVIRLHAGYIGLIASSTFALLDVCYPKIALEKPTETYG